MSVCRQSIVLGIKDARGLRRCEVVIFVRRRCYIGEEAGSEERETLEMYTCPAL